MDSEFTRMFLAIANAEEKERLYFDASKEFDRVFTRAKNCGRKVDELIKKKGFWNLCKLMYYAWRRLKLLQKSEMLYKIVEMRLQEWKFANKKI